MAGVRNVENAKAWGQDYNAVVSLFHILLKID